MGITKFVREIRLDFEIYGLSSGVWEIFEIGSEYEAFLGKRKIV